MVTDTDDFTYDNTDDSAEQEDDYITEDTSTQNVEVTITSEERPFLSTEFEDYSVSEGLLLCLLLLFIIRSLYRMFRKGFSWLF